MKYRSRTEIISMILRAAIQGATKTRIMYAAYLSYAQVHEYLQFLEQRGLIWEEEGTELYKLTQKGMDFLRACEELDELLAEREGTGLDGRGKAFFDPEREVSGQ